MTTIVYKDGALHADRRIWQTGSATAALFYDGTKIRTSTDGSLVMAVTGETDAYDLDGVADIVRRYEHDRSLPKVSPLRFSAGLAMSATGTYYMGHAEDGEDWFRRVEPARFYTIGSGGCFATMSLSLGRGMKRVFEDVAKYDRLTGETFERVVRPVAKETV